MGTQQFTCDNTEAVAFIYYVTIPCTYPVAHLLTQWILWEKDLLLLISPA